MKNVIFGFIVLSSFGCSKREVLPPSALLPVPSEEQMTWHRMEMNAFIHFTTNTFTGKEWGYGNESPSVFNPTSIDANQWISTLKDAGMKGVILTTKHHDGFCLWPSQFTEHSVRNSPYKGDVVRAVSEACKENGLKFGIYLSPWDRNRADYGTPAYITYYRNQLQELFTQYGPVFEMWFDGANGGDGYYAGKNEFRKIDGKTYYDWPGTLKVVRDLEPNVIFFSDAGPGVRWVGNEKGVAGETNWNTITPDTLYAGKAGIESLLNSGSEGGTHWIPAETDVSIRPGWFYHEQEDSLVKTPEKLFDIYLTSVGRGSTLLLNVPPDKRGLINEKDVQVLKEWRTLIDKAFANNIALNAPATADNYRGGLKKFSPANAMDGDPETYWATDDGLTSTELTISIPESTVNYVLLQEYIRLGQRVELFEIQAFVNNEWKTIGSGTTIGYKRILKTDPVMTGRIKIIIQDSRACPAINTIAVY